MIEEPAALSLNETFFISKVELPYFEFNTFKSVQPGCPIVEYKVLGLDLLPPQGWKVQVTSVIRIILPKKYKLIEGSYLFYLEVICEGGYRRLARVGLSHLFTLNVVDPQLFLFR